MQKVLIVGSSIPQGLLESLKNSGVQANLMRFSEHRDFQETYRLLQPDAAIFLWAHGEEDTRTQSRLIDDHIGAIPTLVLNPSLWQRYAQAEGMDIHIGATSEPGAILEWIRQVCPGHA